MLERRIKAIESSINEHAGKLLAVNQGDACFLGSLFALVREVFAGRNDPGSPGVSIVFLRIVSMIYVCAYLLYGPFIRLTVGTVKLRKNSG